MVEPKRAKLREAQAVLASANAALAEKQGALAEVEARVQALQRQLAEAQQAQQDLAEQVGGLGAWGQWRRKVLADAVSPAGCLLFLDGAAPGTAPGRQSSSR